MNYLAIDTSNDYLAVALKVGGRVFEYFSPNGKVRHSVNLMPAVENLFTQANASPSDVDVFCAVVGPGSFTGIRIGVATIKGFADALKKKVLAVTAFDLCSYNDNVTEKLCLIDAAHGNYYACGFSGDEITFAPRFCEKATVKELKDRYAFYSVSELEGIETEKIDVLKGLEYAVEKNLGKASADVNSVTPLYLRLSQAEEGRK